MADVLIVCVREDEPRAKALADMFEAAGFSIGGAPGNDAALRSSGAGVVVWSQASIRSRPFLDAAQRVINANKAVVASLIEPPPPESVGNAPAFDLSRWSGDPDDPSLDPLFFAVDRMVNAARAAVGAPAAEPPPPAFQPPPNLRPAPPAQPALRAAPLPPRPAPRPAPPQPTPPPAPPAADPLGSEAEHWRAIRNSRDPADFLDYLTRYGADGAFTDVAELRLKQLTQAAPAPAPRLEPPPPRRPVVASDPPPPLRSEPPAPRRETARRDPPPPAYEPRYEPEERPKAGGGVLRALILIVLLGGGALAGGLYFGGNLDAVLPQRAATEDAPAPSAAASPAGGDVDTGAVRDSMAFSDVANSAPPPRRDPPPQRQREEPPVRQLAAAEPPPQPAAPGPASLSPPPTQTGAGPISLNPGAAQAPAVGLEPGAAALTPLPQTIAPAAASPPPQPARAGVVSFSQRPSARRISDTYPSRAMRDGVGGRVELDCTVLAGLNLTCSVASETPAGMGFGQAALSAAGSYRAQPTLSDGASAVGARTRIVVQFQAPAQ